MIRIENLSKGYKTKKSTRAVIALSNINLEFEDRGMIFLLGKSGSGKTTLLNLIGGLDKAEKGVIYYNGQRIDSSEKQLDSYRNLNVGFIFQDYNLLEKETVAKNIELATSLQSVKSPMLSVEEVLSKVELSGYEKRYPNELSGGQKQRVAIARALIKNSSVILADEPTGNLDSQTSESIFDLLKEIGKEKLVIVVSHDKEFAEKYGDRIIELKDGEVVSDTINHDNAESKSAVPLREIELQGKKQRGGLRTAITLKMGARNLLQKKVRTIFTLLLAILTTTLMTTAFVYGTMKSEISLSKIIADNNINQIIVYQNTQKSSVVLSIQDHINDKAFLEILNDKNSLKSAGYDNHYIIESKQRMLDFGFEFIFADEISNDTVYLTDYQIDEMARNEMVFSADGINYEKYQPGMGYNVLRGKYIKKEESWLFTTVYKLAGIVKTDKDIFYDKYGRPYGKLQPPYTHQGLYESTRDFNLYNLYKNIYCNQKYYASTLSEIGYHSKDYEIKLDDGIGIESLTLRTLKSNFPDNYILTSSGVKKFEDMNLQKNEAIVSMDVYNKLFQTQLLFDEYMAFDEATNNYIAKKIPEKLGENLQLTVKRNTIDSFIFNNESIKIVGIQMKDPSKGNFAIIDYTIYANTELFKMGAMNSNVNLSTIVNVPKNEKEILKMLTVLRDDYNIVAHFPFSSTIYKYEEENIKVVAALYAISIVSMLITVLVAISLISLGITAQKKEIGILRALGASKKDTFKIYLFEGLILSTIIFIISLLLTIVFVAYENTVQALQTMKGMIFLSIQPLAYVILTVASFVLILAAVAIPLGKLSSMKPVDCIRQN